MTREEQAKLGEAAVAADAAPAADAAKRKCQEDATPAGSENEQRLEDGKIKGCAEMRQQNA